MQKWYTVKVKYTKQLEDGRLKRVTEPYLFSAINFTDAETRTHKEVGESVRGEFDVTSIALVDYADIFHYEDADVWYKCKVAYLSVDEESGKEKRVNNNFLVTAHNVKEAYDRIDESLKEMMVSYETPTISETPIVDIFPAEENLDVELSRVSAEEAN